MRNLGTGKWIAIIITVIGLIILGVNQFYVHVMAKPWSQEQAALEVAQQNAKLSAVTTSYHSVWNDKSIYWVIQGQNDQQQDVMVWVKFNTDGTPAQGNNAVHVEKTAGTVTQQRAMELLQNDLPGAEAVRAVPGSYNGKYAWQVFAKSGETYYYVFYNFRDGTKLGGPMQLPSTLTP
ncbi:cell wall elongation regulator TseB-like domain-containing protein [Paenibacillus kandeliae]|uniref:cell wall elongation regulator TseB-like domain-containing protein n=1 Tax=Paenibacillus kandeliae TaxID=3231269 RepID=UPI003459F79E